MSATAGDAGALDDEQHEHDDRDVDPAHVPGPDLARHVRTRAEEAKDGDREYTLRLPGEHPPREGVGDGLGAPQLEEADHDDRGGAEADQKRDEVYVQQDVIGVHRPD